jgi:hypothetical protein
MWRYQPTLEKVVARFSIIQERGLGRRSGGVSFNDSCCGICTEGFAIFLAAALSVTCFKNDFLAGKQQGSFIDCYF